MRQFGGFEGEEENFGATARRNAPLSWINRRFVELLNRAFSLCTPAGEGH
jgi:hypothetical protein